MSDEKNHADDPAPFAPPQAPDLDLDAEQATTELPALSGLPESDVPEVAPVEAAEPEATPEPVVVPDPEPEPAVVPEPEPAPAIVPEPEPEPEPAPEPAAVVLDPPSAPTPTPEPTPTVSAADASYSRPVGSAAPSALSPEAYADRPEVLVGAAFAGGFLAALILKRLGR